MSHFVLRPLVLALVALTGLGASMTLYAQTVSTSTAHVSNAAHDALSSQRFHQDHVLGTSLDILVVGTTPAQAARAYHAATREIARLDQILSTYRNDSEISALNHPSQDGRAVPVSADLYAVIQACEQWHSATCGAFSARLGQLIDAKQHNTDLDLSAQTQLAEIAANANVSLDAQTQQITRPQGVKFAPDALAKGYIIDRALQAAHRAAPELKGLLLDIGGDVQVWGQSPRDAGWQVGLRATGQRADNEQPNQVLALSPAATPLSVAYSGQGARDQIAADGRHDSHLLTPSNGQSLNHVEHSIVVAPRAADADALATAIAAMTPAQAMALIEQLDHTEAQLTLIGGETFNSSGWHDLVATDQTLATMRTVANESNASKAATWPSGYRAMLDYDVPKLPSNNYQAPYLVIWVTDSERKLVRTLNVFGPNLKWVDSNYIWWKRYGRTMTSLDTVAKPSRAPGHYSVVWDGKDDAGNTVAAGKYTLHIEAAREHGGHSYQSLEIDASPTANSQSLPAKDELGALSYRFGRAI